MRVLIVEDEPAAARMLAKGLREQAYAVDIVHIPVLMLTARDAIDARVEGFDSGADDYLIKPFFLAELLARVRALVRRRDLPLSPEQIEAGPVRVDTRTRDVFVDGTPIVVTAREYALLEFLCSRVGEVVTRRQIAEHVWDSGYDPLSNVIDDLITRWRGRLKAHHAATPSPWVGCRLTTRRIVRAAEARRCASARRRPALPSGRRGGAARR